MAFANGWTKEKVREQVRKYNNGTQARNTPGGFCQYQAADGNRCFIGAFLPEEHKGLLTQGAVVELLNTNPDLWSYVPFDDLRLLCQFQDIHDQNDLTYGALNKFLDTLDEQGNPLAGGAE